MLGFGKGALSILGVFNRRTPLHSAVESVCTQKSPNRKNGWGNDMNDLQKTRINK